MAISNNYIPRNQFDQVSSQLQAAASESQQYRRAIEDQVAQHKEEIKSQEEQHQKKTLSRISNIFYSKELTQQFTNNLEEMKEKITQQEAQIVKYSNLARESQKIQDKLREAEVKCGQLQSTIDVRKALSYNFKTMEAELSKSNNRFEQQNDAMRELKDQNRELDELC